MKYTLAFSALLAATLLGANENNFEVSGMAGYTIANDGQYIDDYGVYGAEIQYNGFESAFKPELSMYYSNAGYKYDAGNTKIYRYALHGVYEFEKGVVATPFFKAGAGYENMSNPAFENRDGVFVDAGAGIKMDLTERMAFKLEAIKMLKSNNSSTSNNLLLMGGLTFTFGDKAQKRMDTVVASEQKTVIPVQKEVVSPVAPATTEKPAAACPIVESPVSATVDSDKDGVLDQNDQCAKTPSTYKVDEVGCPVKATINDHFKFDSDHIDATATSEINAFAIFMKENPSYKATIIGHTDSIGTPEYNQQLSKKRAEKVKDALVEQGIEVDRLSTLGKGEELPIMSNMLKEGRAENRRIELELHE